MQVGGKGAAVLLSVLIVVSTIAPFAAVAGAQTAVSGNQSTETPAGNQPTATPVGDNATGTENATTASPAENENRTESTDSGDVPENLTDAPPVIKKYYASQEIASLDAGGHDGHAKHINRSHDRINGTLPYYQEPIRLDDSAAFTDDAEGVRALAHLHDTNQSEEASRAARLVYEADDQSARTSVRDARRALERYSDEMDKGQRQAAESQLQVAERALDHADREASRGDDGRKYYQHRAKAITQLRTAHRHANMVLWFVDRDTEPEVTIDSSVDPIHDGNETVQYTVTGNVSDPRPSTIENVTVTVNGNRTVTAQTATAFTAPARNASYRATVNLTQRVNTIEVTVTDGDGEHAADEESRDEQDESETKADEKGEKDEGKRNGKAKKKGKTEDGQSPQSFQQSSAVLLLDGDGLSEEFERDVTETEPLDYDSNSSATATNEANNGTIDGHEDFDGDRLTTLQEREAGADPLDSDTDDDDLTDWQELAVVQMDPLDRDSDSQFTETNESDDETLDSDEDLDGDGLTNGEEFDHGSSPLSVDGDADGLKDPTEIKLGTDPLNPDTDEDFLRDGQELEEPFNTDPLDPDTDDNGVLDGNETYTTSVENESVGVTIETTGAGNAAAGTSVMNETSDGLRNGLTSPALVSEFVSYEGVDDPVNTTIRLEYDEETLPTKESDLAVYRMNRSTGVLEQADSTIDAANDTVEAEVAANRGLVGLFSPTVLDVQYPDADEVDTNEVHRNTFDESDIDDCTGDCSIEEGSLTVGPIGEETTNDQQASSSSLGGGFGILGGHHFEDGDGHWYQNDNCPTTYNPSQKDSDGDGIGDACDSDGGDGDGGDDGDDGDDVIEDLCSPVPGDQSRECPDSSTSTVSISIDQSVERIEIDASGEAAVAGDGSSATLSIEGVREDEVVATSNGSIDRSWVFTNLEPSGGEDELRIKVSTTGMAGISLENVRIWKDTDGDGFSDKREESTGFYTNRFGRVTTDAETQDTDGDGVDEDVEIVGPVEKSYGTVFPIYGHPNEEHSDDDSLSDDDEIFNYTTIKVVETSDGDPYRWGYGSDANGTMRVYSNALWADTDGDGLGDGVEREVTKTDTEQDVTYAVTKEHQQFIDTLSAEPRIAQTLQITRGAQSIHDFELDDRTDDFDFVFDDSASNTDPRDRVVFTALDGAERTDIWFNNQREVVHGTDPWDPDTDDDGLTDGQEVGGLTMETEVASIAGHRIEVHIAEDREHTYNTNPLNPDTDGDGYWDGWIGVYGVDRTDNVVLYREHLHDTDVINREVVYGLYGDEVVQGQPGVHPANEGPLTASRYSGELPNGGKDRYHSNIHIGELQWGSLPQENRSQPDTSLTVEVDFYEDIHHEPINTSSWEEGIENNFRLYGLDVDLVRDETFGDMEAGTNLADGISYPPGSDGGGELETTYEEVGQGPTRTDEWMLISTNLSGSIYGPYILGKNPRDPTMVLHEPAIHQSVVKEQSVPVDNSPYRTELAMVTSDVAMHEIAHSYCIGFADDEVKDQGECRMNAEVYSGSVDDPTNESIGGRNKRSLMSTSFEQQFGEPMNGRYFIFSIEELLTIRESE